MKAIDQYVGERAAEDELLEAIARVIREGDERRPTLRVITRLEDADA